MFDFSFSFFVQVLVSILKSLFIAMGIVIVSYLLEKITGLKLLISDFKWEKSPKNARIIATRNAVFFFVLTLAVYIYDLNKGYVDFNVYSFVLWFIISSFLKRKCYWIQSKYQAMDANKTDDDFT